MRIGRVRGTVTATAKDARLVGLTLLVTDVIDSDGNVLESSLVAADTCGAGVGDTVLLALGAAARLPQGMSGAPTDAAAVAVVDRVDVGMT
ncbi:MAG: EutN/CcmL family microcompartment protein [Rhodobacter sp.]|nr:EutN/CcmL family microcompartment protein [Rhodobacter sp.]MCY4169361.1 EutN/CcmL family microcompartment protein [Rhodobacter sp.]MCY4243283.1 EutN/CcmL family microcompartment protein [Rhodobacter sp.]